MKNITLQLLDISMYPINFQKEELSDLNDHINMCNFLKLICKEELANELEKLKSTKKLFLKRIYKNKQ